MTTRPPDNGTAYLASIGSQSAHRTHPLRRACGFRQLAEKRGNMVTRRRYIAFTLAELLVTVGVLVLLVLLFTQLLNSAATITTLGHKQMDADSQTRQVLDRMAIDFAQMIKRSDVDYYIKSSRFASGSPPGPSGIRALLQPGNDKIAFYSAVPGYYPSTGSQSPVSLVAYRLNPQNKLERMGKGLVWNAARLRRHRVLRSCSCRFLSHRRFLQSCRIQRLILLHSGLAKCHRLRRISYTRT